MPPCRIVVVPPRQRGDDPHPTNKSAMLGDGMSRSLPLPAIQNLSIPVCNGPIGHSFIHYL